MNRKTALTAAGAIVLTLAAGTSAMAVNLGILDDRSSDRVGDLQISSTSSTLPADPNATVVETPPPSASDAVTTSVPGATDGGPVTTFDDHGGERPDGTSDDGPGHDVGDDHGGVRDDDHRDDDSGHGSDDSGHGGHGSDDDD
jgi:hypothetical protein